MTPKWEYVGTGRHRQVWRRGDYVIKVPMSERGVHDNWHERRMWLKYRKSDYIPYASCRLIGNFFLLMEYAHNIGPLSDERGHIPFNKLPEWASYVDSQQVGYNRHGQIVAYDYGVY